MRASARFFIFRAINEKNNRGAPMSIGDLLILIKMTEEILKSKARIQKEEKVGKLTESFSQAKSLVFWDYSGLSVPQVQQLRQNLQNFGSKITVAKNTLISLAFKNSKLELSDHKLLEGPVAILLAPDEIDSLKTLFNFIKLTGSGSIKFGFLNQEFTDKVQLDYLATLPSKEAVFGQITASLSSSIQTLVNILQANSARLVYILGSRR